MVAELINTKVKMATAERDNTLGLFRDENIVLHEKNQTVRRRIEELLAKEQSLIR